VRRFETIAAFGLLISLGCATAPPPPETIPTPVSTEANQLGPGDVLEIKVFREPDLAGTYRLGSDGEIEFPLIGAVKVSGRMPEEVAGELRTRLADGYLVDPQVTVFVKEQNSQKIHVLGEVKKPGTFAYENGMSIIQAITYAGGFTKLAAENSVVVTRARGPNDQQTFKVAVADIQKGRANNFELRPGDIINVPEAIF
jgi:polysaccharide export outer membrane protein